MYGHVFVFRNRRGDRIKLLYWDSDGYVIVYKRLEAGVFRFPAAADGQASVTVRAAELAMLLDLKQAKAAGQKQTGGLGFAVQILSVPPREGR